ncbi:MAG: hypothetical protein KDC87_01490 [Planctomycetes bacterium]|nr:hypothetical protein [Planctomycetota bacterium]MCB9870956.1 hypothetical protein [Planctomycetota bacterium]MCB9888320.1 hypothetical protein [Planctomycetota bacterium]
MHHTLTSLPLIAALAVSTAAQAPNKPGADDTSIDGKRAAKLQRVCQATAALRALSFTTSHSAGRSAIRGFAQRGRAAPAGQSSATTTKGVWQQDLLSVEIGDHSVLLHGRSMVAKSGDGEWMLRRGKLADGSDPVLLLDPQLLFSHLASLPFKVLHAEVGALAGKPVETYTVTLTGDAARTLLWTGSVPQPNGLTSFGGNGAVQVFMAGGNAAVARPAPDVKVDLAISFDPGTQVVHKVHGRVLSKANPFNRMIAVRAAGGVQLQQDEEEEPEEETGKPAFKDGLPVRKSSELKKLAVAEFTYTFSDHGTAIVKGLDARARTLLRLPSGR